LLAKKNANYPNNTSLKKNIIQVLPTSNNQKGGGRGWISPRNNNKWYKKQGRELWTPLTIVRSLLLW
jgi:hypothetical protein